MRVALITNEDPHHKYWVSKLYKNKNVEIIIHPKGKNKSIIKKIISKKPLLHGKINFVLKVLSIMHSQVSSKGLSNSIRQSQKKYFAKYQNDYLKIPSSDIFHVETVNCDSTIRLLKNKGIEVVFFLGGEIVKKDFINQFKFCFNYHSGISPYYNGNKTNFHAMSDGRPNFLGGTLMKMNEKIDGGEILMHYFCSINENDSSVELFKDWICGSVKVYEKLLGKNNFKLKGVKQKRSFRYIRNIDWNIINDYKLDKFNKNCTSNKFLRNEKIIDYCNSNFDIEDVYSLSLKHILQ